VGESSVRAVLTRPVLIAIQNYGWLALLDISFWAILTVFLPIPMFAGGLNLPPPTIGLIFSTIGLVDGFNQLTLFPRIFKTFGPKRIMTASMMSYWAIFTCIPWMHEIAKVQPSEPGTLDFRVWGLLGLLVIVASVIGMGYSASGLSSHFTRLFT